VHEPSYLIGEIEYSLETVVGMAQKASGLTAEGWNNLEEDDRHAKIDIMLDEIAEKAEETQKSEREKLAEEYKTKFGKAPAANVKIETIKAKLAE
jgi:hypothetical protein